jgi:hypothetical protein
MKLRNDTGFSAELARAQLLYRDLLMGTLVVKAAYEVSADGVAIPLAEQLPVLEADVRTDLGSIDGDVVPIKPACDVAVMGHARSRWPDRPVEAVEVNLRLGPLSRSLVVFGDRQWTSAGLGWKPSAPKPFTLIPLTYENAFGGSALFAGELEAPYAPNPRGKGFVRMKTHVADTSLPNVEEPDQLIARWEDTPLPASLAPLPRDSSLRVERGGFDVSVEQQTVRVTPAAFSFAHPRMVLDKYPGGTGMSLAGMGPGSSWQVRLPELALHAHVRLGDAEYRLPLEVDTVCLLPDYRRFFLVARRAFVYQFLPERVRSVQVVAAPASSAARPTTIAEQRRQSAPLVRVEPVMPDSESPVPFELMRELNPMTNLVEALPLCPSG